jgi:hypothetical protein
MPPRSSLTSSFALNDTKEEVHCPLDNQDGSKCRKRCTGVSGPWRHMSAYRQLTRHQEKRYRSMQEHIRRAHQEHYIPKLPATEESFLLMINTPPSESRNNNSSSSSGQGFYDNSGYAFDDLSTNPATPRNWDDIARLEGTANAAAALAGLGGSYDKDSTDGVSQAISRRASIITDSLSGPLLAHRQQCQSTQNQCRASNTVARH